MNVVCRKCFYYDKTERAQGNFGYCRRYAPRPDTDIHRDPDAQFTVWPLVSDGSWCGEFSSEYKER